MFVRFRKSSRRLDVSLAANDAATAKERLAKIERGEDVKGGFGKAMTCKDLERPFWEGLFEAGRQTR
jgi:hypothetical protein